MATAYCSTIPMAVFVFGCQILCLQSLFVLSAPPNKSLLCSVQKAGLVYIIGLALQTLDFKVTRWTLPAAFQTSGKREPCQIKCCGLAKAEDCRDLFCYHDEMRFQFFNAEKISTSTMKFCKDVSQIQKIGLEKGPSRNIFPINYLFWLCIYPLERVQHFAVYS